MLRFEIKYGPEGFNEMSGIYDSLLRETRPAFIHLDSAGLKIWLDIIGDYKNVVILTAHSENKVIGIAMMYKNKIRLKKIIPHIQFRFIADDFSDWNDFIIKENHEEVTRGFLDMISGFNCNEILLKNLDENSGTLSQLKKLFEGENLSVKKSSNCYYIGLSNFTKEDYYKNEVSKKFVIRDLNRLYNHLSGIDWKIKELSREEITEYIDLLVDMNISLKIKKDVARTFEDDKYIELVKRMILEKSESNDLAVYSLMIDNNITAYMVLLRYGKKLYWWNTGYNFEYRKYSPSKILLNEIIKKCFDDGIEEFNFMRGESEYKTKWTGTYTSNYQVRYLSNSGISGFFSRYRGIK